MKTLMLLCCLTFGLTSMTLVDENISFTLRNTSLQSIPLIIPGVMNPNLSPMSNSGVGLRVGQKIFFKHKRKKHLLLEVTADLEGQTLIVNQLIKERKKELGLKF